MKALRITAIILLVAFLTTGFAHAFFLTTVCVVTGSVTFHGQPAERGLPLAAYIGGDKVAESFTKEQGKFELRIPEYDPAHPATKGYQSREDIIQVKLNGKDAKPTFSPEQDNLKINLHVEQALNVKLSTWGKIKALFK